MVPLRVWGDAYLIQEYPPRMIEPSIAARGPVNNSLAILLGVGTCSGSEVGPALLNDTGRNRIVLAGVEARAVNHTKNKTPSLRVVYRCQLPVLAMSRACLNT